MAKPLEPVDLKRCQAEKPSGNTFMTLGGRVGDMVRCDNKPRVVATESKPGEDGRVGSMSLCDGCHAVFRKQMPPDFATFKSITKNYKKTAALEAVVAAARAECAKFQFPDEDRPELWEALQALDAAKHD
jgi:hypothetical protein